MSKLSLQPGEKYIKVSVAKQQLDLIDGNTCLASYPISTAKNGIGQVSGSECTPLGWHIIRAKIGQHAKANTVFVGRRATGELFSEDMRQQFPERDWILTRILWLSGLEKGFNRGGEVDTMRRYIYIHGCPDSDSFDKPSSHGCVKMYNQDVIALFDMVDTGIRVIISED